MNKEQKELAVENLVEKLSQSSVIYLADISGLNAKKVSDLRRNCFKANIRMTVVKNTLLNIAMQNSEKDFGNLPSVLKGNTSLMLGDVVANVPAKLIRDFNKKEGKPTLKGAYIEEAIYVGEEQLGTLCDIKSKEEVIGDIIGLLQSPIKNVISGLKSGGNKLSGVLKTLADR